MAGEQDIGKGGDHVKLDRIDRTTESTAEDSVIAGNRKQDHQQRHQEMKDFGRSFQGMNKLYQQETGNQVDDGSGAPNDESVTIVALNPDGSEVKASGKTGLNENDLTTSFRRGLTVNPAETAQEILKAAQNLSSGIGDSSKLLASNVAPNVPNLDQMRQSQNIDDDSDQAKVAQNFEYDGRPPTLLPDPRMMKTLTETVIKVGTEAFKYGVEHPYRGRESAELAKIPNASWQQAYEAFPELASLGADKSTQLMKAIIANELHHYDMKDTAIEGLANQVQAVGPFDGVTMALTQITVKGVRNAALELEKEVTEGKRRDNPLQKYLEMDNQQILSALHDPKEAPLLVAANLAHNARMYTRHNYPVTAETLGYGFNPDLPDPTGKLEHDLMPPLKKLEESPHVKNIRKWLNQLGSDK